jgi:hypothetical protein
MGDSPVPFNPQQTLALLNEDANTLRQALAGAKLWAPQPKLSVIDSRN